MNSMHRRPTMSLPSFTLPSVLFILFLSFFSLATSDSVAILPAATETPTPTPTATPIITFDFEGDSQGWTYRTPSPGSVHYSHWQNATALDTDPNAIGISSPYDESTNYFALWDSADSPTQVPYQPYMAYEVDWLVSTNRGTTNAAPSMRFRIGLSNNKAFAYTRIYPGDWLPLAQRPAATVHYTAFVPPIPSDHLYLAFSLIDWANDFRGSAPAGEVYLEEVSVYLHDPLTFSVLTPIGSFSGSDFDSWTFVSDPNYTAATNTREADGSLSLSSGIGADRVYGTWDSPPALFSMQALPIYFATFTLSSPNQLGGPDLRLRGHTDDFRYAWYSYYVSSYTAGESALPPDAGMNYNLIMTFPAGVPEQPCHLSFDLIDFSGTFGGTLTLHSLELSYLGL